MKGDGNERRERKKEEILQERSFFFFFEFEVNFPNVVSGSPLKGCLARRLHPSKKTFLIGKHCVCRYVRTPTYVRVFGSWNAPTHSCTYYSASILEFDQTRRL